MGDQNRQHRPQHQQQRRPAVVLSKEDGDPKDEEDCLVYDKDGNVKKVKGKDGKEVEMKKKWARFNNDERALYRKHGGGSSTGLIIIIVVVVLLIIGAVVYFLMCTGGSDDDEELV